MKNYILMIALISFLLSGCEKFLEVEPKGKAILKTFDHYNGLLNNSYLEGFQYLKFTATTNAETGDIGYSFSILGEVDAMFFMSDDVVANSNTYGNYTQIQKNFYTYADNVYKADDNSAEWGAVYSSNYIYNLIIKGVMDAEGGTEAQKAALSAEARVNRAYMHYWAAQLFALPYSEATADTDLGIPLVTTAETETTEYKRSSLRETYDFIVNEIKVSIPSLPEETYNRNRLSKLGAYYILGEVYFQMKKYNLALEALKQADNLVNKSKITLHLYDYNQKISSWYISFLPNYGLYNYPNPFVSEETIYVKQTASPLYSTMASQTVLDADVYALFTANDHRKKIFSNKGLFSSSTVLPGYQRALPGTINMGPSMPDLVLMKAECEARTNDMTAALEDLSQLRIRRMPTNEAEISYTSQQDLINKILLERKREFAATGKRWLDMRRLFDDEIFNNVKKTRTIDNKTFNLERKRLALRIPPKVLSFNPSMINND